MRRVTLWTVTGLIHREDEPPRKAMRRSVQFEADDFADASAHAEQALLVNWSRQPHVAIPLTLAPVLNKDGEPHVVYVRT